MRRGFRGFSASLEISADSFAAQPEVFNFRFSADARFKEEFERLAEVLGVENAQAYVAREPGASSNVRFRSPGTARYFLCP